MMVSNKHAFGTSLDLGLVISVVSPIEGIELSRGYPMGKPEREPDLKVVPTLEDKTVCEVTALTEDGVAFLELVA